MTAIAAFAGYFAFLTRRWPMRSEREALAVGGQWVAMTVAFEFAFGRLVAKKTWGQLLADYDISKGRAWPLVLAWIGVGPAVLRRALSDARLRSPSQSAEAGGGRRTSVS